MPKTKLKRVLSLLLDPDVKPKSKYELAKKAECTPSWVIMIIKKLEKKKLVKNLKVLNAKALFALFHEIRPKKQKFKAYSIYSISDTNKLIQLFQKTGKEYAFTTYLAENLIQKYLFTHRIDVYIKKEDLNAWHEKLTKIGTYGGGNIKIISAEYDELFNKKQIHDEMLREKFFNTKQDKNKKESTSPWIVNTPQLISDLYIEGGPAEEAAKMLLEKLEKTLKAKK